jgi:hypothetical protein
LARKVVCAEMGPEEGAMTRKRHTEEQIMALFRIMGILAEFERSMIQ